MFQLDQDSYDQLVAHARAEYPNEACALLGGAGRVEKVYALPNAEASPSFYVVEPKAQLAAMNEMDERGWDLVGIFHSHTFTEAYPSRTDVELAAYPDAALAGGVVAATDVTGFGLLGHLHRMLRASGAAAEVHAARVPFLPGAAELAAEGFISGGTRNNAAFLADKVVVERDVPPVIATLLHDAQTSGGMLLAVPPDRLAGLVTDLRGRGVDPALAGMVVPGPAGMVRVRRLPPS